MQIPGETFSAYSIGSNKDTCYFRIIILHLQYYLIYEQFIQKKGLVILSKVVMNFILMDNIMAVTNLFYM